MKNIQLILRYIGPGIGLMIILGVMHLIVNWSLMPSTVGGFGYYTEFLTRWPVIDVIKLGDESTVSFPKKYIKKRNSIETFPNIFNLNQFAQTLLYEQWILAPELIKGKQQTVLRVAYKNEKYLQEQKYAVNKVKLAVWTIKFDEKTLKVTPITLNKVEAKK
ncbi:hypothetical protein DID75_05560 [Candidatus Marinamargulisbacteria bacterium SCGC AG-410-N11]|nr:hypothetical protein DID75_05560 [Candidatus Marinamargulisbacteria bacterium SCGC AG-410-N11]